MPRRIPTVLTMHDMKKICFEPDPHQYADPGILSGLRPAFSKKLEKETLCLSFPEKDIWYRFDCNALEWSTDGEHYRYAYSECLESDRKNVFLIRYLRTDAPLAIGCTLILDQNTGLATLAETSFGTIHSNRDTSCVISFGALKGSGTNFHAFTEELCGKVLDWKFADNVLIHLLFENRSCCEIISPPPAAWPEWADFFPTFNPTKYVKIADSLYFIVFNAPGASGMELCMLMDLSSMTIVGAVFGINQEDALRSYTFGGRGSWAKPAFTGKYTCE